MKKTKIRYMTIAALFIALALILSFAVGSLFVKRQTILALEYNPNDIFTAGDGGNVGASKADEGEKSYLRLSLSDNGEAYFRRDLALKWFAPIPEGTEPAGETVGTNNPAEKKYYNMQFAFAPAEYSVNTSASTKTCPRCGETGLALSADTCTKCSFDFTKTVLFERFEIAFESAEESYSKKGVATNTIVAELVGEELKFAVRNSFEQPEDDKSEEENKWELPEDAVGFAVTTESFTVRLDEKDCSAGEFAVYVNDEFIGKFTNVGGYYMEYLTSTPARDPMTFRAELPEETGEGYTQVAQTVKMLSLNGQSFEVNASGKVYDNADPVLVVNEAIYAYTLGRKWSLTYEAIDVCDSSVSITRRYAMVNASDGEDEEGNPLYHKPLKDDYKALTTSTVFIPTNDDQPTEQYVSIYFDLDDGTSHRHKCPDCGYLYDDNVEETPFAALTSSGDDAWKCPGHKEDGTECGAAKSRFTTESSYTYLTWYAADENQTASLNSSEVYECPLCGKQYSKSEYEKEDFTKCTNTDDSKHKSGEEVIDAPKEDFKEVAVDPFDYIIVNRSDSVNGEKSGPQYVGVTAVADTRTNEVTPEAEELAEKYQQAIDEVVFEKDEEGNLTKDLKLSAGDGSYFYLPSLRDLIASENADYRNLRFSIYYKKPGTEVGASPSSATSLRYNALRFEIDEAGKYAFKILATDAAGNAMKYYLEEKLVTVSSSNIWDIDEIPTFSFEVTYTGATVENREDSYQGYRDSSFTITSFDIVALSGYETKYTLYRFDDAVRAQNDLAPITYENFRKDLSGNVETYKACLVEIKDYGDITEDDPNWADSAQYYQWDSDSSLSFIPREITFYVVKLEVTEEARLPEQKAIAYQAIDVRNPIDSRPDPTYWLENNVTSVVLFSISGALLVIIIILFIVKPSDKKIEEVDVNTLRGGKKNKKNKKE